VRISSLALHESQRRRWENQIGRSGPFWEFARPRLQELFPAALATADRVNFVRAVNVVTPSLSRAVADEVTCNLHILTRVGRGLSLLEGALRPSALPEAWNSLYAE